MLNTSYRKRNPQICLHSSHFKVTDGIMRKVKWNNSVKLLYLNGRHQDLSYWMEGIKIFPTKATPSLTSHVLPLLSCFSQSFLLTTSFSSYTKLRTSYVCLRLFCWWQRKKVQTPWIHGDKTWATLWKSPKFLGWAFRVELKISRFLSQKINLFILLYYILIKKNYTVQIIHE